MNKSVEQMLAELDVAVKECIVIPNAWLPEEYHENCVGGRTLAELEKVCDNRDEISQHVKTKALKAENIKNYRKQVEENGKFEYNGHTDELQLHRNQMAMCIAHPAINIDEDN
jgi:hypothetical protein